LGLDDLNGCLANKQTYCYFYEFTFTMLTMRDC